MAATGDARFTALFDRYARRLTAYLLNECRFRREDGLEAARDIVQETFARLLRHGDRYRGDAEWAFLKTTAHNLAQNRIRAHNTIKRNGIEVPVDAAADVCASAPSPEESLIQIEKQEQFHAVIRQTLTTLTETTRLCLSLRMRDYSYKKISEMLDIPMHSVKTRLNYAKKRLLENVGELPDDLEWPDDCDEVSHDREE